MAEARVKNIRLPDTPYPYEPYQVDYRTASDGHKIRVRAKKPKKKPNTAPKSRHTWTDTELKTLREMKAEGCTNQKIAETLGISVVAVISKIRHIREKEGTVGLSRSRSAKTSSRQNIMQGGAETEMSEMH